MQKHLNMGFSLIELLICCVISMLLMGVLMQHLLSVGRQYVSLQATLGEAIELQWVFDFMRARIRHAGFTPCRALHQLKAIDTRDNPEALTGLEVPVDQTSQLVIRKMDEEAFRRVDILSPNQLRVAGLALKPNQSIIISDCQHAEVHEVFETGELIKLKKPLVFQYSKEVYLGLFVSETFFLKPSKGLFLRQNRVDWMLKLKDIRFDLQDAMLRVELVSALGQLYQFKARVRAWS